MPIISMNMQVKTMDISGLFNTKNKSASKRQKEEPSIFHISILELIPRSPEKITVRQLMTKLDADTPHQVRNKTEEANYIKRIQRALSQLMGKYEQIEIHENGRTLEYSWASMAEPLIFPSLDSNTALVLAMASHYLDPILPDESLRALNRLFMRAKFTLATNAKVSGAFDGVSAWKDKVAVLHQGLPREVPRINAKIESVIYDALLHEKAVKVKYQAWNRDDATEQVLSPQGLFLRGQLVYIFAVNHKHKDAVSPLSYLLLRIQEAIIVHEPFYKINGFKAQQHLANGTFGVPLDDAKQKILLKIRIDKDALKTVLEQPLSKDQKIQSDGDNWTILNATVNYTLEMKQWIRSHAHHLEVLEPQELREEIRYSLETMTTMYRN